VTRASEWRSPNAQKLKRSSMSLEEDDINDNNVSASYETKINDDNDAGMHRNP
jgi:hypothetical protein